MTGEDNFVVGAKDYKYETPVAGMLNRVGLPILQPVAT
jgi:hypothetical protein